MQRTLPIYILMIVMLPILLRCTQQRTSPVPRRTAYPRAYVYDSTYISIDSLPLTTTINAGAEYKIERRTDGSVWLTIGYPRYNVVIYCTYTPVDSRTLHGAIENRIQRMHLNVGAYDFTTYGIESESGYVSELISAPSAMPTPLQFISSCGDSSKWLLSGSVFFEGIDKTYTDSLAPVLYTVDRDVRYLLQHLK